MQEGERLFSTVNSQISPENEKRGGGENRGRVARERDRASFFTLYVLLARGEGQSAYPVETRRKKGEGLSDTTNGLVK